MDQKILRFLGNFAYLSSDIHINTQQLWLRVLKRGAQSLPWKKKLYRIGLLRFTVGDLWVCPGNQVRWICHRKVWHSESLWLLSCKHVEPGTRGNSSEFIIPRMSAYFLNVLKFFFLYKPDYRTCILTNIFGFILFVILKKDNFGSCLTNFETISDRVFNGYTDKEPALKYIIGIIVLLP